MHQPPLTSRRGRRACYSQPFPSRPQSVPLLLAHSLRHSRPRALLESSRLLCHSTGITSCYNDLVLCMQRGPELVNATIIMAVIYSAPSMY